jgi:integrase
VATREALLQAALAAFSRHGYDGIGAASDRTRRMRSTWSAVDLDGGCLRVVRSWDHRGRQFVEPKTKAGHRTVPLTGWLVEELRVHRDRTDTSGLVFANGNGNPLNPSNVRRDVWMPLKKRAGVRLGEQPKLRLIEGGQPDVRETLENTKSELAQRSVGGL